MTSLEVTGTDAFLDMPQSSQLLYFHLNSLADDDGFVANPKSIMRNCGSQADDLKLLIAKKFVIAFEDGVCVIKHWRINNFIRKDIYKETKYLDLKRTLFIRPNGAYTLNDDGKALPIPAGHFNLEDVNESLTSRQPRLGKVRIGKDRLELGKVKESSRFAPPSLDEVSEYITHNGYSVDPEAWYAFYESNGWKVGKNKMVSWKGAVATWEKRNAPKLDDYQKAMKVLDVIRYENGKPNKAYLKKVWNGIDLAAIKVALESFYPDQMELLPRETSLVIQNLDVIKKHLC